MFIPKGLISDGMVYSMKDNDREFAWNMALVIRTRMLASLNPDVPVAISPVGVMAVNAVNSIWSKLASFRPLQAPVLHVMAYGLIERINILATNFHERDKTEKIDLSLAVVDKKDYRKLFINLANEFYELFYMLSISDDFEPMQIFVEHDLMNYIQE